MRHKTQPCQVSEVDAYYKHGSVSLLLCDLLVSKSDQSSNHKLRHWIKDICDEILQ